MIGKEIIHFEDIDSTNSYIKKHYKTMKLGTCITTDHQTAGYGRMNRLWIDDSKSTLMFSIYFKKTVSKRLGLITQFLAASIIKALEDFDVHAKIKWPNDILINNKKICGILVENIIEEDTAHIIAGVGLNVNNDGFYHEIKDTAVSMKQVTGKTFNKDAVLQRILDYINIFYIHYKKNHEIFVDICKEYSCLIGKKIYLDDGELVQVLDIDSEGKLVVNKKGQIISFSGSEVTLHHAYKE